MAWSNIIWQHVLVTNSLPLVYIRNSSVLLHLCGAHPCTMLFITVHSVFNFRVASNDHLAGFQHHIRPCFGLNAVGWSNTTDAHLLVWAQRFRSCVLPDLAHTKYTGTVPEITFSSGLGHRWRTMHKHGALVSHSSNELDFEVNCAWVRVRTWANLGYENNLNLIQKQNRP